MQHPVHKLKAELSVFFALSLVILASLLLNLTEAARTQGARTYFTMAADSAIDSLFSQYHRKLWEDYRLLGLEMYSQKEITDEYGEFLKPYVTEAGNWYALSLPENSTEILSYELLTDGNGEILRKEILDYMKFGIAFSVMELTDMMGFKDILKDGAACSEISSGYSFCSREAEKTEKILTKLSKDIQEHNKEADEAARYLSSHDGEAFLSSSGRLSSILSEIKSDVESFNDAADKLQLKVLEADESFEARFASGELSPSSYETLKGELSAYRKYSDEQGEMRIKVASLSEQAETNLFLLSETESEAEEAMNYLLSFIPGEIITGYLPPETEGGEPVPVYGEEEPDEDAAYSPALLRFSSYKRLESPVSRGTPDTEKEAQLNNVKELLSENMLSMILPSEYKTPGEPLKLSEKPSDAFAGTKGEEADETVLSDRLFITEYILQMLNSYKEEGSSERHLEAEYIIYGKETDSENLSALIEEIIAIRTGLNLVYLLKDTEKRETAVQLSLAITGLASATPLSTVVFILILSTWALGQAVLDARDLLHGSCVPVMHTGKSFYLSLEGLLSDFSGILNGAHESRDGTDYDGYLRLLLFMHMDTEREYRILDVIQMNIKETQQDFLMKRIYTGIQLETEAASSHLFSGGSPYRFSVRTFYSY